jgi:hypothetical protein
LNNTRAGDDNRDATLINELYDEENIIVIYFPVSGHWAQGANTAMVAEDG